MSSGFHGFSWKTLLGFFAILGPLDSVGLSGFSGEYPEFSGFRESSGC